MEPVGTLGERAAFRRDGVPRDRVGGQRHPRQAPVCAGLKKEQRAKGVGDLETVKVKKESQMEE